MAYEAIGTTRTIRISDITVRKSVLRIARGICVRVKRKIKLSKYNPSGKPTGFRKISPLVLKAERKEVSTGKT
jgi:hypothetical protein